MRSAGNGRTGLIEFQSTPEALKQQIIKSEGNPYSQDDKQTFINQLKPDQTAIEFYNKYRYEDGRGISDEKKTQYICESEILNLYKALIDNHDDKVKLLGKKANKGVLKSKLSLIINDLKKDCYPNSTTLKYPHKLPSNVRALNRKLID